MRILLAEDDSVLADGLSRSLRRSGHAVDHVGDGASADRALRGDAFDLLILDLGLPRLTGLDVLQKVRQRALPIPILILTASDSVEQRVRCLDLGADDYMSKPFALSELEARVRALARRGACAVPALMRFGSLALDQAGRLATLGGRALDLSSRELALLEILLQRAGRLVPKEHLLNHLYEWGDEASHNAIEVYVCRLRKKLEAGAAEIRIATVRGLGYSLEKTPADLLRGGAPPPGPI